jgi:serpin B
VQVYLPRFKAGFDAELSQPLSALGMADAFSEQKADFSGMTGEKNLFIKLVRHKAVLEVNEEGAEAAAATGVVMSLKMARQEPVFRADRPFLCAIRDDKTGALLFLGAINNPE